MAIQLKMTDGSYKTIDSAVAGRIRELCLNKVGSHEQLEFLTRVDSIIYSPELTVCVHRYVLEKVIPMRVSRLYVYACRCGVGFTTDVEPPVDNE